MKKWGRTGEKEKIKKETNIILNFYINKKKSKSWHSEKHGGKISEIERSFLTDSCSTQVLPPPPPPLSLPSSAFLLSSKSVSQPVSVNHSCQNSSCKEVSRELFYPEKHSFNVSEICSSMLKLIGKEEFSHCLLFYLLRQVVW